MATYCDKDYFALRRSSKTTPFTDWDDYTASEDFPDENVLDEVLEACTATMNDRDHLNVSSNITSSRDTTRLKDICYKMACRMLGMELQMGLQGGAFAFSPADYLSSKERSFLLTIAKANGKRKRGRVVF